MVEKVCRHCGKKLTDFKNNMMLGCPYCYQEFSAEIQEVILKVQGKSTHIGKVPANVQNHIELPQRYQKLLKLRQECLINNDITTLAKVDEEIKKIKIELQKEGVIL